MAHQQNHLAKTRKNIFDKSIEQLLSELELARKTLQIALMVIEGGGDLTFLKTEIRETLIELQKMKQNRG